MNFLELFLDVRSLLDAHSILMAKRFCLIAFPKVYIPYLHVSVSKDFFFFFVCKVPKLFGYSRKMKLFLSLTLLLFLKRDRGWRTFKRPGVDAFLEHMAQFYEIVVYSDQLNMVTSFSFLIFQNVLYDISYCVCKLYTWNIICYGTSLTGQYVDPVVERLDQKNCIRYKLSRGATRYVDGKHYRV